MFSHQHFTGASINDAGVKNRHSHLAPLVDETIKTNLLPSRLYDSNHS